MLLFTPMNPLILISAFTSLLLGLGIQFWVLHRRGVEHFYTTLHICWLLIALFPVLLIFAFFPDSTMSGTIKGVSIGGVLEEKTVHLNELKATAQSSPSRQILPIVTSKKITYRLKSDRHCRIGLIAGDIRDVQDIGDCGSPRSVGSINASTAGCKVWS